MIIEIPEKKRLPAPVDTVIDYYRLKGRYLRAVLNALELKDLKRIAEHLELKVGGNKTELVQRIWLSKKIDSLGFITS